MAPKYRLTYFDNRGAAEPSRFIFAYAGVEYEDRRVTPDSWKEIKPNYPWGTVPVLEEDGKILGQSGAILRYLGKKFGLAGDNDVEAAKADEHVEAMNDLKNAIAKAFHESDEVKKAEAITVVKKETMPKILGTWEKILAKNGGFLVGKKFTYADFNVASWLNIYHDHLGATLLDNYPALKKHYDSVLSAKGIKEWVAKRPTTKF